MFISARTCSRAVRAAEQLVDSIFNSNFIGSLSMLFDRSKLCEALSELAEKDLLAILT